jgi:hypothetical protein
MRFANHFLPCKHFLETVWVIGNYGTGHVVRKQFLEKEEFGSHGYQNDLSWFFHSQNTTI